MRSFLFLALLAVAACQTEAPAPVTPPSSVPLASETAAALTGRAWVSVDSVAAPGSLVVFLDGVVVQTSCVETYRVDPWRATGEGQAVIEEGTDEIPFVYVIDGDALVLSKSLVGGEVREEQYRVAEVPVVCPDLRDAIAR